MFRIKMRNAKLWKDLMNTISSLVEEATFKIGSEGIVLRQMDPSHVAMIDFEWPKAVFDEFECKEEAKLCVNIGEMLKLLKRVSSDESIVVSLDKDTAKLNLVLAGKYSRTFKMPTLEPLSEDIPVPKITFNAKARMTTSSLKDAIDDVSIVSEHVKFEMSPERFLLTGDGVSGSATVEIGKENESVISLEAKEESRSMFSLSFLSSMIRTASALSEIVTVEFATDMPVRLNFEMPQEGKLQYYLAPRIED